MLTLIIFFVLSSRAEPQAKTDVWAGIVPLSSTRKDTEARLGEPKYNQGYSRSYDTRDFRITVWYGGARNSGADGCNWQVPPDTVFTLLVAPLRKMSISEMPFDVRNFERQPDREARGRFYYFNPDAGLTVATHVFDGEELVEDIEIGPTSADRKKYCRDQHP